MCHQELIATQTQISIHMRKILLPVFDILHYLASDFMANTVH